jgi:hypothetical protein
MQTKSAPRLVLGVLIVALLCVLTGTQPVSAQEQSTQDRLAALKGSLALSQENLRTYEWIETTVFNLKGEEKMRGQNRCYYGADGTLQKVEENKSVEEGKKKRGLRGKLAEGKKEELADYMEQTVALVKSYVPLDPARLQKCYDGGKVGVDVIEPGKRARLNFRDYNKPGDVVGAEINLTNNTLLALTVKSYLEKPEDAISLDARFAKLNDGTTYADAITLNAPGKEIKVTLDNSGYRKMGQ